jgi:hypothetical protein
MSVETPELDETASVLTPGLVFGVAPGAGGAYGASRPA